MEGLNKAVGAGVPIEWNGETYILDGFQARDWGLLVNQLVRLKKKDMLQTAYDMKEFMPESEWKREWEKTRERAEKVDTVSEEDVDRYLNTSEGVALILFVVLDRRYPGKFKHNEMLGMILENQESIDKYSGTLATVSTAANMPDDKDDGVTEGNEQGQDAVAVE